MASSAQTIQGLGSGPVRLHALEIARGLIGERETLPPGLDGKPLKNQGPIVERVARPFLSPHRFDEMLVAGKLQWCAFFVCYCFLEALTQREDAALIRAWKHLASGECGALWERLEGEGWARPASPADPDPAPGDVAFLGHIRDGEMVLTHVAFVEAPGVPIGTIEGNAGPKADRVWAGLRAPDEVAGYARIPW